MTTIVYDHKNKTIAFDSRETSGSRIVSDDVNKSEEVGGVTFFIAGISSDKRRFIECYFDDGKEVGDISNTGFAVVNGTVYHLCAYQGKLYKTKTEYNSAVGSGMDFAISALDFGKSVIESVEYAKTRDYCTGGKIRVFDVVSMEFNDDV